MPDPKDPNAQPDPKPDPNTPKEKTIDEIFKALPADKQKEFLAGRTVELKGGGKEGKSFTFKEAMDLAEQGFGAQTKFESLAAEKKANAAKIELGETIQKIMNAETPDEKDVRKLAELTGQNADNLVKEMIGEKKQPKADDKKHKATELTPEQKANDEWIQKQRYEEARGIIRKDIASTIDSDEEIAKMIKSRETSEKQKELKDEIVDLIWEHVEGQIRQGVSYGTDLDPFALVKKSTRVVREKLRKLGIPSEANGQPSLKILGLSPTVGLPADVVGDKPIDRVRVTSGDYENNFAKRAARWVIQRAVKGRK